MSPPARRSPTPAGDPGRCDRYAAAVDGPPVELREKGSRFLARAYAAADRGAAEARLSELRRAHFDATHHCWALRLAPPEHAQEAAEDDGEPAGTAGAPILNALRRAGLYDTLVVVVRWFGGTKLGTGGLARAYGAAATAALAAAERRTVWRTLALQVACTYDDVGAVEAVLARAGEAVRQVDRSFAAQPTLSVQVVRSRATALAAALRESTGGRADISLPPDAPPAGTSPPRTRRTR